MSGFSHDFVRVFAFTQTDELRVSQMISLAPLEKLYLGHGAWLHPQCRMPDYAAWLLPELPSLH
jgi:hypothetical protein